MLELFFNTKTTFSLLRGEWRENGSFVGDKYPIQSAGRMAKNGCDSFDLGPKASTHKLGLFYYSIQNLPRHLNSSVNNVMMLAICYSTDAKKYGFKPILEPFLKEMKLLESDSGVELVVNGDHKMDIHGALVSFSGDSLAVHDILGFLSPSAIKLCKMCMADRRSIQVHFTENEFEPRTIDDHNECAESAAERVRGDPESGIKTVWVELTTMLPCSNQLQ